MASKYLTHIDKDLCSKCKGICCKNCGCSFYTDDFEDLNEQLINKLLDSGQVSITAHLEIYDDFVYPILYLRARNVNRGEIDLLSIPTRCANLGDHGCEFSAYTTRPSSGLTLIPRFEDNTYNCYRLVDEDKELDNWHKYQALLKKIIEKRRNMSIDNILKQDAYTLFFNYELGNFDGTSKDVLNSYKLKLKELMNAYKEQTNNAHEDILKLTLIRKD